MARLPIGDGTPSPGVCCAGPSCWEKTTRKYGLRNLPLCDACAAALCGRVHSREPVGLPRTMARHPAGRKYGLRNLPLCDACAAALCGQVHAREPVSLPRTIGRHPAGRKLQPKA